MKTILALILCIASTQAADVTFNLADFTAGVITNRQVKIEPKSTPRAGPSNAVLSRDSLFRYSDTNGTFTVTNMQYGTYQCTLMGPYAKTEFRIYLIDTNGAVNASDYIVSGSATGLDTEDGLTLDLE